MNDSLRKALEKAKKKPARPTPPPPQAEAAPVIDRALYLEVSAVKPGLAVELAKRLDVTRTGIYWMLRPGYGHNSRARKTIVKFNEALKAIKEEIRNSLNH